MSFTLIQNTGYAVASNSSPSQTFASPCTAGSLLIAFVCADSAGLQPITGANVDTGSTGTSVTDTLGNTWKRAGFYTAGVDGIFYCESAIAGSPTVTFNKGSTGASNFAISLAEYTGHLASHPLTFAGGVASSAQQPAGGAYAPVAGCLIVNQWSTNGVSRTWSSASGVTFRTGTSSVVRLWGDLQNSVAGDNHMSAGIGAAPDSVGVMAMFLPATYTVPAGYSFVRTTSGNTGLNKGGGTCKAVFCGGNQGGNLILVTITMTNISTNTVTSVTDTIGNSYSLVVARHLVSSLNDEVVVYAAQNCIDTTNDNIITVVSSSTPANMFNVQAFEYSGQPKSGTILDTSNQKDGNTNLTNTITAARAGELIVQIGVHGAGGCAWGSLGVQTDRTFYNVEYSDWANVNQGYGIFGISSISVLTYICTFSPSASGSNSMQLFAGVSASAELVALLQGLVISGNAGVAGATVSWTGTQSGSTTADGSGAYSIPNLGAGSYTITPTKTGYSFSPVNSAQTVTTSDITGVNFTATPLGSGSVSPFVIGV